MSVLLEALKKAADDKKREAETAAAPTGEVKTPNPSREAMTQTLGKDHPPLSEPMMGSEPQKPSTAPDTQPDKRPAPDTLSAELKVPKQPSSETGSEPPLTLKTKKKQSEASGELPSNEPDDRSEKQASAEAIHKDESAPEAEKTLAFAPSEPQDVLTGSRGEHLDLDTRLAMEASHQNIPEPEKFKSDAKEENQPLFEQNDTVEPEKKFPSDANSDSSVSSSQLETDSEAKGSPAEKSSVLPEVLHPVRTSTEKNDWSLSQIPGYGQEASSNSSQQKGKRWLNLMQSGHRRPKRRYRWTLGVLISLLIVTAMFVYGYVYFHESQIKLDQELKRYQLPLPKSEKPQSGIEQASPESADPLGASNSAFVAERSEDKGQAPVVDEPIGSSDRVAAKTPASPKVSGAGKKETTQTKPDKVNQKVSTKQSSQEMAESVQKAKKNEQRLRIRSEQGINTLKQAHAAYHKGQWETARQKYKISLNSNPESTVAMMGLAATFIKEGDYASAMKWYQKVLRLHPGHEKAMAARAALVGSLAQSPAQARQLKDWVRKWPDMPQLQAALGQFYARNRDWPNAQSHFFKAYELAPRKASYALNLAISLDRLGKYTLARRYYREAQSLNTGLSENQSEQIRARLAILNQFLSKES
ncbi:tetratricopeptide repeat protein [Thiomicrospira sp. WB1]|uniref:tetratricopeptide repeat protein n=1 Tax=Thiomicrospira sp. WB1 TaxID=1685380 RepID=UPI00074B2E1B|nr:tetratricopeptide repeat protein [Thiomicrospira sp. WB1]KUJ72734.1 hypothetical protein AVO41_02775 [Thiomicrospira sp. WB1]